MTKEKAIEYLEDMLSMIGTTATEYWTEKEAEKMRDAISALLARDVPDIYVVDINSENQKKLEALCRKMADAPVQVLSEITDEQAILHLRSTGWMQNHDREMYEQGLKEQLADDTGSYDALIPCEDAISRQAAIDAMNTWDKFGCNPNGMLVRYDDKRHVPYVHYADMVHVIKSLPSVTPEIIRCKDCKHYHYDYKNIPYCDKIDTELIWEDDDYCSRAERKPDD